MCFAQEKAPRAEGRCAAFWSDDPRGGALFSFILVWPPTWEGTALLPTAMVFVSYGFVLVQVQVHVQSPCSLLVVIHSALLASVDCSSLFRGCCGVGTAVASSRECLGAGEAAFP